MKKSIIILGMVSISMAYAQQQNTNGKVGINTEKPLATLDLNINSQNMASDTNEGLLINRMGKQRVSDIADANLVKGTLVFVDDLAYTTSPANPKVVNITAEGFYYYDGETWKPATGSQNTTDSQNTKSITWLGNNAVCLADNVGDALLVGGGKYECVNVTISGATYPNWRYTGVIYKNTTDAVWGEVYTMLPALPMQRGVDVLDVAVSLEYDAEGRYFKTANPNNIHPYIVLDLIHLKTGTTVSTDDRYVGSYTEREELIKLGISPDNIRWVSRFVNAFWTDTNNGIALYNQVKTMVTTKSDILSSGDWLYFNAGEKQQGFQNSLLAWGVKKERLAKAYYDKKPNFSDTATGIDYNRMKSLDIFLYNKQFDNMETRLTFDYLPNTVVKEIPKS